MLLILLDFMLMLENDKQYKVENTYLAEEL